MQSREMAVASSSSFGSPTAPRNYHRRHIGYSRHVHADIRLNFDGAYMVIFSSQYVRDRYHSGYRTNSQLRKNQRCGRQRRRSGYANNKTRTNGRVFVKDKSGYGRNAATANMHMKKRQPGWATFGRCCYNIFLRQHMPISPGRTELKRRVASGSGTVPTSVTSKLIHGDAVDRQVVPCQ